MTNRREFLHLGVAALSLPIAARAGVLSEHPPGNNEAGEDFLPLYKVFFDERFAACRAFGEEMRRYGSLVEAIRGDITQAWYSDLYHEWKLRPAAIAGMTAPGAVFCLEMLARDAGLGLALRIDHWRREDGWVEHDFYGPEEALGQVGDFDENMDRWPERITGLVARVPVEQGVMVKSTISTARAYGSAEPGHLVTWVIASLRGKHFRLQHRIAT